MQGRVRTFLVDEQGQPLAPAPCFVPNLVMNSATTVLAKLLRGLPGEQYRIGAAYLEFENNSGAPVTPPSFAAADTISYYATLQQHPHRDYLRVPVFRADLDSSDPVLFPDGNRLFFEANTVRAGTTGRHGKPFGSASQSRIFGGALVATPSFNDPTQDVIFSRFYYSDTDRQLVKPVQAHIGLNWEILLSN